MKTIDFAIFFDMDGTLFNTEKILAGALNKTFDYLRKEGEWGGEPPYEECKKLLGSTLEELWSKLLPKSSEAVRKEADRLFLEGMMEEISLGKGEIFPGVIETLKKIKEMGIPIFVASNGLDGYIQTINEYYGLHEYFTDFYSSGRFKCSSKIELVLKLLEDYKIKNAIMIGDRKSDIEAAIKNNILSIGCDFGFANPDELKGASYHVKDFKEILPIVKKYLQNSIESSKFTTYI